MKIAAIVARILLGIIFLVFGLNGFLNFLPQGPMPTGLAGQFLGSLFASHYAVAVFAVQVASAVLFLTNRYVPLALVMIAPVIVNILLFHALMSPAGIAPGAIAAVLWFFVAYGVRSSLTGILHRHGKG